MKDNNSKKSNPTTVKDVADITICDSTAQMIIKARNDGVETAFDRAANMKPCPIGAKSACCKHCAMGPCRINANDPYAKVGICGATIDTIQSRNLARMVACGTAAHVSHGRNMLNLFRGVATGDITDFKIKNTSKLETFAQVLNIETADRSVKEIALDLCDELEKIFIQTDGEMALVNLVPEKTLEAWRKLDIVPRGAMLEVMELLQRTHAGMDQHYENLTKQISRTALVDGWGGSMVATELSDILFGTPSPVAAEVDMGCLKEDAVNIIIHGHEPYLVESMVASVNDPSLIKIAKEYGANGINLVGMCCSGLEMLSRHGIPHAGNFMSTEAVLVTGAVDAFGVDVQCIQQSLVSVGKCYGTQIFTTNQSCRIEGAEHIEFNEHDARSCTDAIVEKAIVRFKNRSAKVVIPKNTSVGIHGFSHEYINYMLGGSFRGSYRPLNDNIINGRIRGVAGVVGCVNPRIKQDWVHVELVKELIKNDVLVVQTGCSQIALAKAGLCTPEAAHFAGSGLREVCEAVGMPPVLGLGACVDNSRILIACAAMVREGGLGDAISELPVAGAAPEWYSEKAIAIGQYFVASGVYTVFGVTFPIVEETKFHHLLFDAMETQGLGKWGFTQDPYEMARMMIAHIDKKRQALGIDKARERTLVDMADRRELAAV